ncbi:MAG: hypothetical protein KDA81_10525, partial [Planctomycetaceae bacterium]|nr:hypothetical protein [Planctomycetaceae bacterium]
MGKMGLACRIGSGSHFPCLKQQQVPFRVSVFFQLKTFHAVVSAPISLLKNGTGSRKESENTALC